MSKVCLSVEDEHASRKNCIEGSSSRWINTSRHFACPRPLYEHCKLGGDAASHGTSSAMKTQKLNTKASVCDEQFLVDLCMCPANYFANSANILLTGKHKNRHKDHLLSKSLVKILTRPPHPYRCALLLQQESKSKLSSLFLTHY